MLPASLSARTTSGVDSSSKTISNIPTGAASNNKTRSITSPNSSRSHVANSEELLLFKRSNPSARGKPAGSTRSAGSGSASSGGSNDPTSGTNGNVKDLNFEPESSKHKPESSKQKPLQALRAMDSSQKRRLAAILSRNKQ